MFKKIFCLILILKLTQARYGFVPIFYGQDSAVIVDTDKSLTQIKNAAANYNKIRIPLRFPLWRHYPRYHILPPSSPQQILAINTWAKTANTKTLAYPTTKSTSTTSTTTSTTTTSKPKMQSTTMAISKSSSSPLLTDGEIPIELLNIAQKKLGLNSLDEIPSLSELGQLLGTDSPQETLNYMKQLTSNEQGIALLKAYIESADYTDNTGDLNNKTNDLDDEEADEMDNIEEPLKVNDEGLIVVTDEDSNDDYELNNDREPSEDSTTETTSNKLKMPQIKQNLEKLPETIPNFMGRMASYMHLSNLLHKNEEANENLKYSQYNRIAEDGKMVSNKQKSQTIESETETEVKRYLEANENSKTPILVRDSMPFNYPVPLRVQTTVTVNSTKRLPPSNISVPSHTPVVHLNTPKMLIPHVQQLARFTQIPSKKIEDFLTSKPKLLELVTKVSRFPINYDRNSPVEDQIMTAVRKVFEQDDDFQKLLNSADTT